MKSKIEHAAESGHPRRFPLPVAATCVYVVLNICRVLVSTVSIGHTSMEQLLSPLRSINVVLVRPESPGNVGAVARVIRNFGLGELRIVGSDIDTDGPAARLAHRSLGVLKGARFYEDVDSAVADAEWIIGTSGRLRSGRPMPATVRSAASRIVAQCSHGAGAILFGPESDGLSLRDLAHCDELIRVPQRRDAPALNLAQAVAVVGAELFQAALVPGNAPVPPSVTREARKRFVRRLKALSTHCGLSVRNRPEETLEELEGIFVRRRFEPHEMAVLELWLSQLEWFTGMDQGSNGRGTAE
ncbi:MAG TPA: RNA methyltransferase [Candidatus Latescibacteria bacterium]|nr:RNA methyltransferase [Candidatus Latescibacterota bacterium]